jgi:hypothetical protein
MNCVSKYLYLFCITISLTITVADYYIDRCDYSLEQTIAGEASNHIEKSHTDSAEQDVFVKDATVDFLKLFSSVSFDDTYVSPCPKSIIVSIWQPPKRL